MEVLITRGASGALHASFLLSVNQIDFIRLILHISGQECEMYSKQYGIFHRKAYKEVLPVMEYASTDIDSKFLPVINKRFDFGEEYLNLLSVKIEWTCLKHS